MKLQAIILGAGGGTRLRPFTDTVPKCLVPLRGKPLLAYQIEALRAVGIDDIRLVAGYQSQAIPNWVPVTLNERHASTNMVYSLFSAREYLDRDTLILYGDTAYEARVVRALAESTSAFAITVDVKWRSLWQGRMENPLTDAETLKTDTDGRILEIGKKPKSYDEIEAQYMGFIRVAGTLWPTLAAHFDSLPNKETICMTDFLQSLVEAGQPLQTVPVSHGWLEVDTVADLSYYEGRGFDPTLFHFPEPAA